MLVVSVNLFNFRPSSVYTEPKYLALCVCRSVNNLITVCSLGLLGSIGRFRIGKDTSNLTRPKIRARTPVIRKLKLAKDLQKSQIDSQLVIKYECVNRLDELQAYG